MKKLRRTVRQKNRRKPCAERDINAVSANQLSENEQLALVDFTIGMIAKQQGQGTDTELQQLFPAHPSLARHAREAERLFKYLVVEMQQPNKGKNSGDSNG
jgi:hypothetical protein